MNAPEKLLREIGDITNIIDTQYPELYSFLDENPMTLPIARQPVVDKKALEEYLLSLQNLLQHHLETHK